VWLAQEVLDERHGGGDEAVGGDGLAVGTGAGLDVERPAAAGRGGQAGGREGGAVTALAVGGLDPLAAVGKVVAGGHAVSYLVSPEGVPPWAGADFWPATATTGVPLVQVYEGCWLEPDLVITDTVCGQLSLAGVEVTVEDPVLDDGVVDDVTDAFLQRAAPIPAPSQQTLETF